MKVFDILNKLEANQRSYKESFRRYAVFAPIIEIDHDAHLLLEVRSNKLSSQPGEISFPGGRIEENESWRDAAMRETCEELNVELANLKWVSDLNIANLSNARIVYAGVGTIDQAIGDISPNKDEVHKIFTVPIEYFLLSEPEVYSVATEIKPPPNFPYDLIPNGKDYNWRGRGYDVPFYKYDNKVIWGLTARIIIDIVNRLKS